MEDLGRCPAPPSTGVYTFGGGWYGRLGHGDMDAQHALEGQVRDDLESQRLEIMGYFVPNMGYLRVLQRAILGYLAFQKTS